MDRQRGTDLKRTLLVYGMYSLWSGVLELGNSIRVFNKIIFNLDTLFIFNRNYMLLNLKKQHKHLRTCYSTRKNLTDIGRSWSRLHERNKITRYKFVNSDNFNIVDSSWRNRNGFKIGNIRFSFTRQLFDKLNFIKGFPVSG